MSWFRRKATGVPSPQPALRRALLCVQTLDELAALPDDDPDTPFARFVAARASLAVGDRAAARRRLHELLQLPQLDVRTRILAWNFLRELAELPAAAAAAEVRGVAIESATATGLETLAAFADHSAQWLQADGVVRAIASPLAEPAAAIDHLLVVARLVTGQTPPQQRGDDAAPAPGQVTIRVFTFAGVHLGRGPAQALERDPSAGPVLRATAALQQELLRHGALQQAAGN